MEYRVLFAYTASVDYPPILGGWANDKIFHKCIYEYIEEKFLSPSFWGDIAHFAHLGGISTHFAFHNE